MSFILSGFSSLAIAIPTLLMGVHLLSDAIGSSGKERTTALLGALTTLCYGIAYGLWAFRSLTIDSMASVEVVRSWSLLHGLLVGFAGFFLVYWCVMATHPEFFEKRKWAAVLPLFGTVPYTILVFLGSMQATDTVVLNFVTDLGMSMATPIGALFSLVALIDWFFYLFLIPLTAFYLYYRTTRGTAAGRNTLILLVGFIVFSVIFLLSMLMRASPSEGYFGVVSNFIIAMAWFLIYYGYRLSGGIRE